MSHVVVVGAGQAGASCVAKLRNSGFDGQITLIGAEQALPYQRPPLSKAYLLGDMTLERLYLRPQSFYDEHDITLRLGQEVTGINADDQFIDLNGEHLAYDHLVLTTGSTPRALPKSIGGALEGVYTVRGLTDVDAMAAEFQPGKHVLIVGGGYIGLEAAAVAAQKNLKVTLVEMAPRILQRVAAPETSDYFRALHQGHGVDVIEGVGLSKLQGDTRVTGAIFSDGQEIEVDFVIVGVGITPNTSLAELAGCTLDNGIHTNRFGQTSVNNIWAAGDCASFPYGDTHIRLESVPNAIEQAEIVAQNIMGAGKPYHAKPWFWSDQYDIKLQIAGLNTGYDRVVTRDMGNQGTSFWYYNGSRLLAVDAMNAPRDYMIGKRLIEAGKSPDPALINNPETDMKALLKS